MNQSRRDGFDQKKRRVDCGPLRLCLLYLPLTLVQLPTVYFDADADPVSEKNRGDPQVDVRDSWITLACALQIHI